MTDWRNRALCQDMDGERWFPIGSTAPALAQAAEAKAICRNCSVATICLNYAITTGQTAGIWGGLDEYERAELTGTPVPKHDDEIDEVTGRDLKPCGTRAAYKRHIRRGEPIDDACRQANTHSSRVRTDQTKKECAA